MNNTAAPLGVARKRLPNRRAHTVISLTIPDGLRYTAGLRHFQGGRLAEVFLNADKIGTVIETAARETAVSLGIGQDTPQVCLRVPPRRPLCPAGHGGTLSRPVPLSRVGRPAWGGQGALAGARVLSGYWGCA